VVTGLLAVASVAYLFAVYLVWEARRGRDAELAEYFRRRALVSAVVVAAVGAVGLVVLHADASYLFDGMTGRELPVVIIGVVCGLGALILLALDVARGARALAVAAVLASSSSGVAQWPYLLPETLTVSDAAAPSGTLQALIVTIGLARSWSWCRHSCCSTHWTRNSFILRKAWPMPPITRSTRRPTDGGTANTSSHSGDVKPLRLVEG
jgi:cytochrome bd ubiquinol oxidase subunit II